MDAFDVKDAPTGRIPVSSNLLNGPPLKWLNLPVMLQNDQHAASISRSTHLTGGTECLS
jgi:hypothetical protein